MGSYMNILFSARVETVLEHVLCCFQTGSMLAKKNGHFGSETVITSNFVPNVSHDKRNASDLKTRFNSLKIHENVIAHVCTSKHWTTYHTPDTNGSSWQRIQARLWQGNSTKRPIEAINYTVYSPRTPHSLVVWHWKLAGQRVSWSRLHWTVWVCGGADRRTDPRAGPLEARGG